MKNISIARMESMQGLIGHEMEQRGYLILAMKMGLSLSRGDGYSQFKTYQNTAK